MEKITQKEIAKENGWSTQYVNQILRGGKSCNKETMEILKKYYPDLKWVVKVRYCKTFKIDDRD